MFQVEMTSFCHLFVLKKSKNYYIFSIYNTYQKHKHNCIMPNLILLDTRIHHHDAIVNAVNLANDVHCVLFDGFNSCLEDIRLKIQQLAVPSFASVGLVQHNHNAPFYKMFGTTSQPSTVLDVASRDPSLQSWSETASFLAWLKSAFGVQHFDMMACAIYSNPDWKYVVDTLSQQTGVEIRASTDDTGSADQGGNWFLESHSGVDLKTVYFTAAIDNFKGILFKQPWFKPKYTVKSVAPGNVITWGNTFSGGDSTSASVLYPAGSSISEGVVSIYSTNNAFAALKSDGSVVAWGSPSDGGNSSSVASQLTSGVVSIYSTGSAFAALKSNGSVVAWGDSSIGGDSSSVTSQLTSGVVYVYSNNWAFAALKADGSVVTWGSSSNGGDSTSANALYPAGSSISEGVVSIFVTARAFAALKTDGSVVTWGNPSFGGNSSSVASQLTSGVVSVYSTAYAFAALKTGGSVVAWGRSVYGGTLSSVTYDSNYNQIFTSVADQLTSGVVSIYPTAYAFAALKTDGSVVAWGDATYGGALSSVTYDSSTGSNLYTSVANNLTSGVVAIYSTFYAFAALKSDGSVVAWGDATYGGNLSIVTYDSNYNQIFTSVANNLTSGVVSIYSTDYSFAALKTDGSVVTLGSSPHGGDSSSVANQLQSGVVSIYSNPFAFAALKSDGSVVAWGLSEYGGNLSIVTYDSNYNPIFTSVANNLTSGVVSIYSTVEAFAAIVSQTPDLTGNQYTSTDIYQILSNAQTEHIFAQQFLDQNGNFTISAQQLRNINIKVPTTVGSSSTTSFDIVIPV